MSSIRCHELIFLFIGITLFAQTDTTADSVIVGEIKVFKDPRLNDLAKKEAEFNKQTASDGARSGTGFRLMLLSTNDRPMAMNIRTQLLQRYPDQKVYMSFQPPYIKLKFGNFVERADAENFRKEIAKTKLIAGNIYIVPETIELKPEKEEDKDENGDKKDKSKNKK